jgi:hypothetical protein
MDLGQTVINLVVNLLVHEKLGISQFFELFKKEIVP